MPVSSGPQLNLPKTIAFAAISLAVGVGLLFLIVWLADSGDVQFKLGDDVFEVGDAQRFAETIDEQGGPVLFSSLSRNRPIYVQHLGNDDLVGWYAIDARSPSDPEGCVRGIEWVAGDLEFRDTCDPATTYPADGAGLLQYDISVTNDGKLVVDLNQDE